MNARTIPTCLCALLFVTLPSAFYGQTTPDPSAAQPAQPAPASGVTVQDTANDLVVAAGKSVLVDSAHPIERVAVGVGDVAEATAVSPTEVLVNGKVPGETSLIIWQAGGQRQFFDVKVRPNSFVTNDHLEGLRREIRTELPGQQVQMTTQNGLIFLHGTVKDLSSSNRAVEIASTAGKVVNLLYVQVPTADPQILLKVRFASVDRSVERQFGVNVFSTGNHGFLGSVTTGQYSPPTITQSQNGITSTATASLGSLLNLYVFDPNKNIGATLEALETQGLAQVLAEPNLLTSNGKQGSFLAGGEFPYAVLQGTATGGNAGITIQFKEFGVRLNFIPTVTPRGSIRLQVAPEVSSLDFADGLSLGGFTVPAITSRKVNTEVELKDGQSFVIGGLLDNRETKTFEKIPFIGDIPVLGKFFQSTQKTRNNTELIVIVTPEIIAPVPPGGPLPSIKYPDSFLPHDDATTVRNPGTEVTGVAPAAATPKAIPVEQLEQSLKPEQPLVTTGVTTNIIPAAQPTQYGPTTAAPAAPAPANPQ